MRALIVAAAPQGGTAALVDALAGEVDITVAADGGAAVCAAAGIVPDVIVGDLDSLDPTVREELVGRGASLRSYPADKDVTDLDLALAEASLRGATDVAVTGAFGARLDHTLAAIGSLARRADLRPRIYEPGSHGWILAPEGRDSVAFDTPGTVFSIVSLGGPATVSATGVRWPLESVALPPLSSWAISNVAEHAGAAIVVSAGTVLVLCPEV